MNYFLVLTTLLWVTYSNAQVVIPSQVLPEKLLEKVNDEYFNFQWNLINYGHVVQQQRSGLEFEPVCDSGFKKPDVDLMDPSAEDFFLEGTDKKCENISESQLYKTGSDISWYKFIGSLEKLIKRDVVVAVVDSGLDTSHQDIISNLARLSQNCNEEGKPVQLKRQKRKKDKSKKRSREVPPISDFDFSKDCFGWDFTKRQFIYGHNQVLDDSSISHGTHISGILSAELGNNLGIAGLSNKIKVLPVKVFRDFTPNELQRFTIEKEFKLLLDTVALGLEYLAVSVESGRTVDAVNLSFGWPKKLTTPRLEKALQKLLDLNIVVVAAAGNDDINVDLFPCAYPGVICVGAHTNSGQISSYSNYGSSVDILAPGDSILSLSRTDEISLLFTQSDDYDFLSGTSQAAPMVAGIAALLKGAFPLLNANEIKAKILSSSKSYKKDDHKFTLKGTTKLSDALEIKKRPFLYPEFKNLLQIEVSDNQLNLNVEFKNLWSQARDVKVKLRSLTPNLKLNRKAFSYKKVNNFFNMNVVGSIDDLSQSSEVKLQFDLSYSDETGKKYKDNFTLATNLYVSLETAQSINMPLRLSDSVKDAMNKFADSEFATFDLGRRLIQPVRPTDQLSTSTEYYVSSFSEKNGAAGIEAFVLKNSNGVYNQELLTFLPNSRGYEVFKFDLYKNVPGDEYIVRSEVELSEVVGEQNLLKDKFVEFHIISNDLSKKINVLTLKPRESRAGRNHIDFLKNYYFDFTLFGLLEEVTPAFLGFKKDMAKLYQSMSQRPQLLENPQSNLNHLFFMAEGYLSDLDNNLDLNTFSQEDFTALQLYYLEQENNEGQMQVRTFSTPTFKQKLLQQFSNYFYDRGFINTPRVHPDIQLTMWKLLETNSSNVLNLLVSFAMESQVSIGGDVQKVNGVSSNYFFIVEIFYDQNGNLSYQAKPLDDFNIGLSFNDRKDDILTYFSINDGLDGTLIGTKNFKFTEGRNDFLRITDRSRFAKEKKLKIKSPNQDEFLNAGGNLVSYKNGDRYFSFYRTQGELLLSSTVGEDTVFSTQEMKVTQFLPGINFKELIVPALYEGEGLNPAIFVNASEIYSRRVYSYVTNKSGDLFSPISLNVEVPESCFTAVPSKISNFKGSVYTFLCQEDGQWNLKLVPMRK